MIRVLRLILLGLLTLSLTAVACLAANVERISMSELKSRLDAGEQIVFLDTRNDDAWFHADQMIPQARRVHDNQRFAQILEELPKDTAIVTYCT